MSGSKIHLIMGASNAGKTTLIEHLQGKGGFIAIEKGSSRQPRVQDPGIFHFEKCAIPRKYDQGYALYGEFYGIASQELETILNHGISPIFVCNDFEARSDLENQFGDIVLSTYIHRATSLRSIREGLIERGQIRNLEEEVNRRYLAYSLLHNDYSYNCTEIDGTILNIGTVEQFRCQIDNLFNSNYGHRKEKGEEGHLLIVYAGSNSGKRAMAQYFCQIGRKGVSFLVKETTRPKRSKDGPELKHVSSISPEYDIRYQQQGHTYALNSQEIAQRLQRKEFCTAMVNNQHAINQLVSKFNNSSMVYLHRDVDEEQLFGELRAQGVPHEESVARQIVRQQMFETYIDEISRFRSVLINTYGPEDQIVVHMKRLIKSMKAR